MSKPSVSVVIPCYNVAATVEETIASVLAQSMADLEIIAVDNNCTDDTQDVLARIAKFEPRLRVIEQPVQGLSAARNAGIEDARGDLIALLDADDLWDRDYLEKHLANLNNPAVGISYSRVRLIDIAGCPTGQETRPKLSCLTPQDLLRSNPCTALIVVRSEAFRKVGLFDQNLRSVEDQEWLFRAVSCGVGIRGINDTLASYRIMPGGLSADLENMLACHDRLLDAARSIAPELVERNARSARGAMLRYCARRAVEQGKASGVARSYLVRMLRTAPELLIEEPITTLKVVGQALVPGLRMVRGTRAAALPAGGV